METTSMAEANRIMMETTSMEAELEIAVMVMVAAVAAHSTFLHRLEEEEVLLRRGGGVDNHKHP
jgi:hypothetical protein